MENWFIMRKGAPFLEISEKFKIHPILARLIRNRDVIGDENIELYLNGTIADLHDGMLMKDMDKTVDILLEKIADGKKIRVIGDYDIDGINATYILVEGLSALGAEVDIDIPDRMKDGYGLNRNLIDRAFDADVDTIITCDNGIAARDEVAYGKGLGMTILITDHHEIPYEMEQEEKRYLYPCADAIVDPKRVDCVYPFKGLCGAAVAYKVIEALFEASGKEISDVDYLMENVAIATVGDVMDLVGENRIFVKQGLEMMKRTKNLGLMALMNCTGVESEKLSAYHIGFVLGPCLNASGRLDTAKRAYEMLSAKTKQEADILAGDLKALNDSRKDMTIAAVEEAIELIETSDLKKDRVLVVYMPDCHESLAGIVAGRLRERYYKPVFVLTKAEEGLKGSGRSIESYHMFEEMNKCKELLSRFGGHKLAAGLSLPEENLEKFRKEINVKAELTQEDLTPKVAIDMQLPFSYITENFIEQLELLEPFGKGNVKPVFVEKDLEILETRILGKNQNVLKMQVKDRDGIVLEALYFGDLERFFQYYESQYGEFAVEQMKRGRKNGIKAAFTFYPSINKYQGKTTIQIIIQNYR